LITLFHKVTGEPRSFAAVDAREILAVPSGDYSRTPSREEDDAADHSLLIDGLSGEGSRALLVAGATLDQLLGSTYEEIRLDFADSTLSEHDWAALANWHAAGVERRKREDLARVVANGHQSIASEIQSSRRGRKPKGGQ
jgi:hypothetical protein